MSVSLTGFGGVGEIGGNAFLLDDGKTRLMLDCGRRFGSSAVKEAWDESFARRPGFGDYFDAFLKARSFSAARDLLSLDLVPALPRLYRQDLGGTPGKSPVDAILISHAHQDHFGLLGLIRPDVPIHTSAATLDTLRSLEQTGISGWETDFTEVPLRGGLGYAKGKKKDDPPRLTTRWRYGDDEHGPTRTYQTAGQAEIGDWTFRQHAVDHSIQGAAGFILERKDGYRVVYTGDFRAHGRSPELTKAFLKQAGDPDVLLIEGTRVSRGQDAHGHGGHGDGPEAPKTDREVDVEQEIESFIAKHEAKHGPGFVGIGYPIRDMDRVVSIWNVARRLGRRLVIQPKQAHLLQTLRRAGRTDLPDPRHDRNLAIYVKAQEKGTVLRRDGPLLVGNKVTLALETLNAAPEQWIRLVTSELSTWERELLGAVDEDDVIQVDANVVTPLDVAARPREFLFTLSYWNMTDLFDIFPDRATARGLYIHSQTQPFNDDLEMTMFKLKRWLTAFHLTGPMTTHVSGHADEATLHEILGELKPKLLVPVHSENPGMTKDWYTHRVGRSAVLTVPNVPIQLSDRA